MDKKIEIIFEYEYKCGGAAYSRSVTIKKDTFNEDTLLILVCAYIHSECVYPGNTIDRYLHNRFPDVHTLQDMFDSNIYNIINCRVEGLKSFGELADGLLSMSYLEAEQYVKEKFNEFNESKKGESRTDFSIWDNDYDTRKQI